MKTFRVLSIIVLISLLAAACNASPAATNAATNAPVTAPTQAVATSAPTAEMTQVSAPTNVATGVATETVSSPTLESTAAPQATSGSSVAVPVATIPPDQLTFKTKLLICSDFPYPPQEFYDENGNPQGLDVDIGTEIARRLGLQAQFVNSVFDTIIAAVTSGKCNIVISAQNITADRKKQVSMIPYFQAGQAFVVQKGDPQSINLATDLCGKSVAAESGTTEADYLSGTNEYAGKGLTQQCQKDGKKAPNVVVTQKDTDALQQLQAGKVAAYATDSPVAAYYTIQHPDQFQLASQIVEPVVEGISIPCGQSDCTNAPLSPTGQAIKAALDSMMKDGTYQQILKKWNLESGAVQPQQ